MARKLGALNPRISARCFSMKSVTSMPVCRPSCSRYCRMEILPNRRRADHSVEVRIVSATNHYLEDDMGSGLFRQDLFYRLDGISITLPTLAERRADIPRLAEYFVQHYNEVFSRRTPPFSDAGIAKLMNCQWAWQCSRT